MFFSSIENIILAGCVFLVHTFLKLKPELFFPLKDVPFLKLIKSEVQPGEKKTLKKIEKQNPAQNVESFEKGV